MKILTSPDNHQYLEFTEDISTICQPLFQTTGINNFLYIRVYQNGNRLQIGTHPDWFLHYVDQNYHQHTCLTTDVNTELNRFILYDSCMDNPVFKAAVDEFNMHHGIIITNKTEKYHEFFHFSSDRNNRAILNFYINNINLLERFTIYFKDVAKSLIGKAKPLVALKTPSLNIQNELDVNLIPKQIDQLSKKIITKHLDIKLQDEDITLSQSEVVTLCHFLHGKTAKEIARDLHKSNRTIEHHINAVKNKLHCRNRSDIHNFFDEKKLFNLLYYYFK